MLEVRKTATLTLAGANRLLNAAVEHAESTDKQMTIAIVDPGGVTIALNRMDGAPLLTVEIAENKAYTAVSYGMPSHQWHEFIAEDDPLRLGIVHTPRLVIFGGGYPITVDGQMVGGIGVSGGHYSDDMAVAEAALAVATGK